MGLFSTLGKIIGGVVGLVPGVGPLVGGVIAKGGELLDAKKSMNKLQPMPVSVRDASKSIIAYSSMGNLAGGFPVLKSSSAILRSSPVLPGGAIASASGPYAATGATPPATFSGKRRKKSKRSKRAKSRKRTTTRRGTRKRRLKFGSAAYRKKYLHTRR